MYALCQLLTDASVHVWCRAYVQCMLVVTYCYVANRHVIDVITVEDARQSCGQFPAVSFKSICHVTACVA